MLDAVRTFILSRPWGREYELIYSNEHLLELTAAGATKGGMILRLASLLGVARKDIYCIGDHKNDIPMLEAVPHSIAMGVCSKTILPYCSYRTTPVLEDGIANALKHYGLI